MPTDDPQARKQAIAALFDRGAAEYDQVAEFFTPMACDLVAQVGLSPGERVLDVGCGRGAALFAAAEAVGGSGFVTGIDLAGRMVELTAADAAARGLTNVAVQWGDAEDPDFPAASFDAVLASLVLFFLPDPAAALRRYATLLGAGGRLGFTTFAANDENFEAAMQALGGFIPGAPSPRGDRQGPFGSVAGMTDLLGAAGFEPVAIVERSYVTRFRDPDEWLGWAWSHGGRATLERIPADQLPAATAAAKQRFAAALTEQGDYAITTTIRLTSARPAIS